MKIKTETENKIIWYDTLTELLNMGFDLEKNSAKDLLEATNELIRIKENKPQYDIYSTGGGFYTAQYKEDNYIYWVENDMPYCLTKSLEDGENTFLEENIVYSIDTKTENFPSNHDKQIYKKLYKMLKEEEVL